MSRVGNMGKYWMCTIPREQWTPPAGLPEGVQFICGQAERGEESGYEHWQVLVCFESNKRQSGCKRWIGTDQAHVELARSQAAREYCLKEDTAIPDTRFSFGEFPVRRNSKLDWDIVYLISYIDLG